VYEDSGASVEYQRGVYARTPIKATQTGDTLSVEIGPVKGWYPGMRKMRGYELRLPADWPPASVTVDGVAVKQAGPTGKGGWSFVGNTLTTIVPVSSKSVATAVTIEVRRTAGLTAHRNELDGFAGAMTRLRGAYDALLQTGAISASPTLLIDAMQTGDRMCYHPEHAVAEIGHLHNMMIAVQASVTGADATIVQKLDENARHLAKENGNATEIEAQKQHRLDIAKRAEVLVKEAGK